MKISDLNIRPDAKMLREFGIVALFGFGLVGTLIGMKWDAWQASYALWGLGAVSCSLALIRPQLLLPLFVVLMIVAFPIGFVISNVILLILYYGLFAPIALVFKVIGRDSLSRTLEPETKTYWISRDTEKPVAQRFKQY